MGYKAAVQVLKQADDLKAKITRNKDLLNDLEAWTDKQKLQTIYHQVLVLDLEYALDKKVELDLWNVGFKNHISSLQDLARDKKNPRRSDFQALLTWALESASGFYLTLLQELCNTFDIDLPFRRRGNVYGQTNIVTEQINIPQTSSCLYICQYCLVHLGDIARYRNQRKQAESFYKQAILVSPTSGHPYNQLGLLEASKGDKLSTVFYYIRGIAVKFPFPASATNLLSTLSTCIDKECSVEKIQSKISVSEFLHLFLCTHGYFHTATELKTAEHFVKSLNSIMTALVATQSFTKDQLIKMTVINLYALKNLWKKDELTDTEKKVRELILELTAGSLSAFLMPVHTLNLDESLMSYYALPAVKLFLCFIKNEPDVLKENVFKERLQIWPSLCKLINNNMKFLKGLNYNKYTKCPLREDTDLQGFLPLSKSFKDFDFKLEIDDKKIANLVRVKRFLDFTVWLTQHDVNGTNFVIKKEINGKVQFDPGYTQPDPTNELLEEMRSFNVSENLLDNKKSSEKKAGILKPQGSLEKSREEREIKLNVESEQNYPKVNVESSKSKRSKQNVALQSIYKKMEENKQVKFNVDEPSEKDPRTVKFDPQKPPPPQPPKNQQFPHPLRTQSFNQNHPAFPLPPPPQQDYLASLRNVPNMSEIKNDQMMPQYQHKAPNFPQGHFGNQVGYGAAFGQGQYNGWQRGDMPQQQSGFAQPVQYKSQENWWQSIPPPPLQTPQNYPRQDSGNFPVNYPPPFTSNIPNYIPNAPITVPKPPQNQYEMFSNLPWGTQRVFGDFDSQSISMRQAMLKEATGTPQESAAKVPNMPPQPPQSQPQGYSLFNTNTWTPNLASLRNSKMPENLPQHSLFGGHGPKSLAQLLEHQQQNQTGKSDL